MTARAFAWRGFVHGHALPIHHPNAGMAEIAGDLFVRALQREVALRFVIEGRRLPVNGVVAVTARRRLAILHELSGVGILVAAGTGRRRGLERCFGELALRARRLVTLLARNLGVSAPQREMRLGMIEAGQVGPGFHGMARFASRRPSV